MVDVFASGAHREGVATEVEVKCTQTAMECFFCTDSTSRGSRAADDWTVRFLSIRNDFVRFDGRSLLQRISAQTLVLTEC